MVSVLYGDVCGVTTGKKGSGAVVAKPVLPEFWALPSITPPKGVAVMNNGMLEVGSTICGTGVGATFTILTLTVRYR